MKSTDPSQQDSADSKEESVTNPQRRSFLGGFTAALVGSAVLGHNRANAANLPEIEIEPVHSSLAEAEGVDDALRQSIDHVVVIYAENRSFNNLFADFPGLEKPLAKALADLPPQLDRNGQPLRALPKIWGGMVPGSQVVDHTEYHIPEDQISGLANAPFKLVDQQGEPLPQGVVTRDLVHAFYQNQWQINDGKNDQFVAWGDSGALVMGYYGNNSGKLRLWHLAREYTLCDNFFMGAFGGSFLNHQYLVAAHPPYYPNADKSPASHRIAQIEGDDATGIKLKLDPSTPESAMMGPAKFVHSTLTPDHWVVNTMTPPYAPTWQLDPNKPGYADASSDHTLVPQHHDTIGDLLSRANIDWAWYAGGWAAALESIDKGSDQFPPRPNFQAHHQPFNYYRQFEPGSEARKRHLRDGGVGETPQTNRFMADAAAGKLPAVSYYKPQGNLNMHAGYSDVDAGDRHIASVVDVLRNSPQWEKMLVIVTFDENGGWWDHVAPPKGDRWGPGTRIPAILMGPHVKRGFVDHSLYDTGSIARFICRRFGLPKLPGLLERELSMVENGGTPPGDLTRALDLG
ncbi:acid phosphatase [Oceanobacter mangrovi]|uniref:acid phosphatase n=1 Tax=Oceanobacter mangrovi TaxID=2862510 RepID=UPI001C8E73DA|nr:acid phosphatase [Oceanobacter mangrovi]